ncbi:MAG: hypothetical protein K0Q93_1450 [Nocardioidaceae bacterium]|nr:hypothetical protein [Nocardioidaceae bacterium]
MGEAIDVSERSGDRNAASALGWPGASALNAGPTRLGWPGSAAGARGADPSPLDGPPAPILEPPQDVDQHADVGASPVLPSEEVSTAHGATVVTPTAGTGAWPVSRETPATGSTSDVAVSGSAVAAVEQLDHPPGTRIFAVANQKGGVGKTTTAVNIAAGLAEGGQQVLLVDLDPQGNASTALGVEHREGSPGAYQALLHDRPVSELVQSAPAHPGLSLLPATIDLAGAEIDLVSLVARESRLRRALSGYLAEREAGPAPLDYVFIDCPPSLGLLTVNALVAAREILIPIQCEYYALEGVGLLLRTVDMVREHLNPSLRVSTILLTMHDARTRLSAGVADEVRRHFPDQVLRVTIPRSVRISEAPSYQQTVMAYDPSSPGALSYREAAREISVRGGIGSEHRPQVAMGSGGQ